MCFCQFHTSILSLFLFAQYIFILCERYLVGSRLGLCLKENYNEIKSINRAIAFYDLDKIKNFKEPELKKILTFDVNKNENKTISNENEINTNEKNGSFKSKLINTKET